MSGPQTGNAPRPRGRLFFFAPGPTNIPDRVLGAMHRPTIDFFDPAFLEVQKRAVQLERNDPNLRLNLARLHLKADEKPQARAELEDLARLGDRFKAQAEVTELLRLAR